MNGVRHPQYRCAAARSLALSAAALTLLALLTAGPPAAAQPFTRTIASGETVVVQRTDVFSLPANESLLIELGGELQGRGSVIGLAGMVRNNGQLRAFKGSENATAVGIGGHFDNTLLGRIEVAHLTVANGGVLTSVGGFLVGGFRLNPGDPLVQVCTGCQPNGFTIDAGGRIEVGAVGGMLNHGDGLILGTLENAGSFLGRNGANNTSGGPYAQTLTVGGDPLYGAKQGRLLNVGTFELQSGNTLRNFDVVSNNGSFTLAGGRYEASDTAQLVNTASVVVGSGGQLVANRTPAFDAAGDRLAAVFNTGRLELKAGATLHNGWFMRVEPPLGPGLAELVVAPGGTLTQADAALLAMAGGQMRVQGSVTGGDITVGNLGGITGSLRIDQGGSVNVASYQQTDGVLQVNGTLTGQVTLLGGDLTGGGVDARINGSVFASGAGGGPPQQPPNCGNAFFACFRPGNSPGHMAIDGDLTMGTDSMLELEVARDASGQLVWDSVSAQSMSFDGALIRVLIDSAAPDVSPVGLNFLSCAAGCNFTGASFEVIGGQGGQFFFNEAGGLGFALAPVPEPGTWAMLAGGLAVLAALRGRRRPERPGMIRR